MNPFEDELRRSLARREPPAGFTARLLAKARQSRAAGRWRWTAVAAAASVAMVFSAIRVEEYRKGQHAKQQLMIALEITSEKLAAAQQKIEDAVQLGGETKE